jgi:hypothetical protein
MSAQERQAPVHCSGPLSEAQLTKIIRAPAAEARILFVVKTCGISFPVDQDTSARLRDAGASAAALSLLQSVAPPARVEPVTRPAVTVPSLSGQWVFGPTSPSGSPFQPEAVALSLSEAAGVLKGTLAGRYRTPKSSGLKPEVRFSFQGAERSGNMRFPWATSDGRNGSVELIRLPNKSDSLEVVWYSQDRKLIFDDVLVRVAK